MDPRGLDPRGARGRPLSAPALVAYAARTGSVALNVVSAALDADARTRDTRVWFARDVGGLVVALEDARREGFTPVAAWSFYSTDFAVFASELAEVKARTEGVGVLHIAGGVHATAEPLDTLRAGFDLAVVGEGEHTITELFVALREGRDPRALKGVAHLDASGSLVTHGPGERLPLDAYPACNLRFSRFNPLEITRGCVYACTFCQTPFAFKARFRHRSVANVREHVDAMALTGPHYVRFVTPTALSYGSDSSEMNLDAVEALLASVREGLGPEGKLYFGTFPSEVRPEHVTPASLGLLARYVDNKSLIIGGQSGSDRVLERTRRGHTVDDVIRAVEHSVRAGFRPDVDFLLGLPDETLEDRRASLALAEKLVGMGARIHSHAFMPLPGTPLRDRDPSTIEHEVSRALGKLEAQGKSYGPWRQHVVHAQALVRKRRDARPG